MTHGVGLPEQPDQGYRIFRIEFADGTTQDYPCLWWTDEQMAQVLPQHSPDDIKQARDETMWYGFEDLFKGELPGYPKAVRIVAEWLGPLGSQPSPADFVTRPD